ncbi:hypothetical protein ABVK25_012096 [Lepraria finkii]|uniref:Aminoglycoside phosphotransferase domain-containing protein n=1 Tax=Lepraria finkii TaxID=1340010 RepID=A0ABR4ALC0_9LECA
MPTTTSTSVLPLDGYNPHDAIPRNKIIQATETAPMIYEGGGVKVLRVHSDMVLKFGHEVRLSEAQNMRFVASYTDIRLPAVMDAWEESSEDPSEVRKTGYILMSHIEGVVVSEIWETMDSEVRYKIYNQLVRIVSKLHQTELGDPGPVGGGISHGTLFTDYGAGPFISTKDMEAWFNERLLVCQQFNLASQTQPSFSGQLQPLVMCHLDIAPRNLMLDRHGKVWLLDWAFAGAYPEHFEYAVLAKREPSFTRGLLRMLHYSGKIQEQVEQLNLISFALSTGAVTRPAGYKGYNIPGYYDYDDIQIT